MVAVRRVAELQARTDVASLVKRALFTERLACAGSLQSAATLMSRAVAAIEPTDLNAGFVHSEARRLHTALEAQQQQQAAMKQVTAGVSEHIELVPVDRK